MPDSSAINPTTTTNSNSPTGKVVVLLSGGQDSATCLAMAKTQEEGPILAVTFHYNQRHYIEVEAAKQLALRAQVPHRIIDLSFMPQLGPNALTDMSCPINHPDGALPSTFVPARNLIFLSIAASIAYHENATIIYTGVCETDFSGYPDCRSDFIAAAQHSIQLATTRPIIIKTPLMHLTKADTIKIMDQMGYLNWYAHTHTCYNGSVPPCGQCPACQLRQNGFDAANYQDPLLSVQYSKNSQAIEDHRGISN
jgi:7-cyano-7-deazaguanine synthase